MDYSNSRYKGILVGCNVEDINDNTFVARNGEHGAIYHNNHRVSPTYNKVQVSDNKKFIGVSNNDLWGLLDENGNELTGIKYKHIDIYGNLACLYDDGYTIIIDEKGSSLTNSIARVRLVFRYNDRYLLIVRDSMMKTHCLIIENNRVLIDKHSIKVVFEYLLDYNLVYKRDDGRSSETRILNIKSLSEFACNVTGKFENNNLAITRRLDNKVLSVTKLIHGIEPNRIGGT